MTKSWVKVREYLPIVAVLLLCMLVIPATQAHAENSNNGSSATTIQQQHVQPTTEQKADNPKPKATSVKPRKKSALDAEVLESPLAYFRDAFTSEEDETDTASGAGIVVITLKALVATLLSTVL